MTKMVGMQITRVSLNRHCVHGGVLSSDPGDCKVEVVSEGTAYRLGETRCKAEVQVAIGQRHVCYILIMCVT